MLTTLAHVFLFLTWPIVLPAKTLSENFKGMGLAYLAGLIVGYVLTLILTPAIQWFVFPAILVLVGLIWGHWIAEKPAEASSGKWISTFAAGMLLAFPLHFLLSHLFIGFIFRPFN